MKKPLVWRASLLLAACGPAEVPVIVPVSDAVLRAADFGGRPAGAPVLRGDGVFAIPLLGDLKVLLYHRDGRLFDSLDVTGGVARLGQMAWLGDTLRILDSDGSRAAYVGPRGAPIRVVHYADRLTDSLGQATGLTDSEVRALGPDGRALTTATWDPRVPRPSWYPVTEERRPYFTVWRDGRVAGLVAWLPPWIPSRCEVRWAAGRFGGVAYQPFCAGDLWDIDDEGRRLAVLRQCNVGGPRATYAVIVLDEAGDTVLHRRYVYRPTAVPRAALDSALARATRETTDLSDEHSAAAREAALGATRRLRGDTVLPPVAEIELGGDGTVWLREYRREGPVRWTVLDERGDPIGRLELPSGQFWATATRELLWVYGASPGARWPDRMIRYVLPFGRRTGD